MTKQTIVSTMLIAVMCGAAQAQQKEIRVQQSAERDGQVLKLLEVVQNSTGKLEKSTYLGIASTPVPAALREQLKLKKGVGLVVERVERNSPAEQAGVIQYDIVEKLDDQILVNAEQFAALVRMQEPGTAITLSIIRQGQPMTITATVVEKEMPVAATNLWLGPGNGNLWIESPKAPVTNFTPGLPLKLTPRNVTITSAVGDKVLTITRDGENMHLSAKDAAGNPLFDGDVNDEAQWGDVPPDIAAEAKRLISRMGLNIKVPQESVIEQRMLKRSFTNPEPQPAAPVAPIPPIAPALP